MCIMLNRKYVHSALCFVMFLFRVVVSGQVTPAVKSNEVTNIESDGVEPSGSGTRLQQSTMSQQDMDAATSIHNALRRQEGASDMEYMTWNSNLASMAQDWADGCDFVHGQPDPSTQPYEKIGQNLHATTGRLNVTRAIRDWYSEKRNYDYDDLLCRAEKECRHYTQVVWASSREIGCAYKLCLNLRSSGLGSAYYVVCNYGPAGNYEKQKPYQQGKACSRCGSKANWCKEGLCNSNCTKSDPGCACAATCLNCGSVNEDTCTCSCSPGWYGIDCSAGNGTEPLTCASPSLLHSNQIKSLSFIISSMTLVTMTSLTIWTIDFLR